MTTNKGGRVAPIHPVLLSLVFPVYLLATNVDQWVDLSAVWIALGWCLAFGTVLLVACARLFGGWERGALVASMLVALFFTFGHARLALAGFGIGGGVVVIVWVGLAVVGLRLIGHGGRHMVPVAKGLIIGAAAMITFNLLTVGVYLVGQSGRTIGQTPAPVPLGDVEQMPDIYYLVFDRYANAETLQTAYGFDNRPFLEALEARGFRVAADSWANYGGTALSLVSSLSANYLDQVQLDVAEPATYGPIHDALRGHLAVPDTLSGIGYQYIHIGNWWEPGSTNVAADQILIYRRESEFETALLETTALSVVTELGAVGADADAPFSGGLNRAHTLYEFGQVEAAAAHDGATYVFAHFLIPHPPYVFMADGSPPTPADVSRLSPRDAYVEQLQWTNARILAMVDHLLDVDGGREPVIILQADEGPYPDRYQADQEHFPWVTASPAEVQEKFGILNAIHFPPDAPADLDQLGFHERISPVNTFRLIFDAYFGANLPILEDRTFLSPDKSHLYDFWLYERMDGS